LERVRAFRRAELQRSFKDFDLARNSVMTLLEKEMSFIIAPSMPWIERVEVEKARLISELKIIIVLFSTSAAFFP
jgi:hypothetical protein